MNELPNGWAVVPLRDVASVRLGKMLDKAKNSGNLTPYLRNVNVRWFSFDLSDVAEMLADDNDRETFSVRNGDLFVCEGGEPGRCAIWQAGNSGLIYQKALHRVRPSAALLPLTLAYQLRLDACTHRLSEYFTGTTIKHLTQESLQRYQVLLPPIQEQERITEKLDTMLTRVDACRDRLARVGLVLKRFRQSVLKNAINGLLTAEWREQYGVERWDELEIQALAQVGTGSTPLRSNPEFFALSGTPWITSSATSSLFVLEAEEFVTEAAILAHRLKIYPVGTLIVAMYGEGKTRGQVTELAIAATINQACAAIVVNESRALRGYVKLVLQANYFVMRELAEGGNQPNLNLAKIKAFSLSLPSLKEQSEIVRRVDLLFAFADRLESRLQKAQAAANRLTPALLAKAFRGELVPQDPNDEPAAELLKRLAAQRAQAPVKRGRKKAVVVEGGGQGELMGI